MSISMAITRALLHATPTSTSSIKSLHESIARRKQPAPIPASLRRHADIETTRVQGRTVHRVTPKTGATGTEIVYAHGGAYVYPLVAAHWGIVGRIARLSGATVTVPLYGLAPEGHAVDAYELLAEVYAAALERSNGRVFLAGDSAGGALSLGQAMRYRDAGQTAPQALLLISPWLDATMRNPALPELVRVDPMLARPGLVEAAQMWAGDLDTDDVRLSPLFGDLAGLPPVHIYQGDRDLFVADSRLLAERLTAAGTRVDLRETAGGFHVFLGAPWTPEARRELADIARVVRG
jgi:acetyl esterase/lipase